jgi:hypothetical protein
LVEELEAYFKSIVDYEYPCEVSQTLMSAGAIVAVEVLSVVEELF